ncbi:unnamed protein product [Thlaspi arvense]|uniref:Protein kinase domain-containing protein n=1 Tax=Thlaspi arvense TaxID=13288 RepID=A0AAU9S515_THLAR|nr:unnamed protein product [Thlaspi arvense]
MREPLYVDVSSLNHVRVLGRGAYGSVSLEEHPRYGFYAKKKSSMHHRENLEKELRIMLRFRNHPRIVQAADDCLHLGTESQGCFIYMEYAFEGTLHNIISRFRGESMPEYVIQRASRMILQGLQMLHSRGYVHCDLKPSNVLVFPSTTQGEPWDLKISDFGSCKEPNTDHAPFCGGTPKYMSPESFWYGPKGQIHPAFDIWSLGCVVYEMFGGKAKQEYLEEYYEWKLFKDISPAANDFLKLCHGWHPSNRDTAERLNQPVRATAAELLNHPFVTQRLDVPHCRCQPQDKIGQNFQIFSGGRCLI